MTSREKWAFFSLGVQYYVVARYSAFAWFHPVSGNLFHHAIEMFLKGYLCSGKSLDELKKLGHRLCSLWVCFKQEVAEPGLDRFDQTVTDLDKFESIRYPDRIVSLGMRSFISITHRHADLDESQARPEPKYQVVVKEIDELVSVIFEKASVNPRFYTDSLPAAAQEYLAKDNEFPAR
jgi:hypothetical protein